MLLIPGQIVLSMCFAASDATIDLIPGRIVLYLCFIAAAALTALIAWLLAGVGTGGTVIRQQGPEQHKAKAGTPSTGGRAFLVALALAGFPGAMLMTDPKAIIAVTAGILTGFIGLADDILKVSRHETSGLKARYKLPLQIVVGLITALAIYYMLQDDTIRIPFIHATIHIGAWKILVSLFCFLTIVNAVNFTDGLDGLASTTILIAALCLGGALWKTGLSSAVVPVILIGICVGFLPLNWNPARIFMGDSGALALGGALAATAMASGLEITVFIIGLVFIVEIATVVMQVVYFRLTGGKRIFRMTPIHHAWELRGYKEPAIVFGFSALGIISGAIGWWSA
jgi:phospho-N-acetylmuramoyl-pentapeptide-transferase